MKWCVLPVLFSFMLTGCAAQNEPIDRVLAVREEIMRSSEVSFDARITADDMGGLYVFDVHCLVDSQGDLSFEVISPETIAGVTGTISSDRGFLTFDEEVLAFELLAEGRISPVCAPWIFMKTLRGGYIKACSEAEGEILAVIDDSYHDNALQLEITFDENTTPVFAEIFWEQYRYISIEISNFSAV